MLGLFDGILSSGIATTDKISSDLLSVSFRMIGDVVCCRIVCNRGGKLGMGEAQLKTSYSGLPAGSQPTLPKSSR
jgi:hypothetical protein